MTLLRRNLGPQIQIWHPGHLLVGENMGQEVDDTLLADLPRVLVLDLRRVQQADSSGLAWLMNLELNLRGHGGRLYLLAPSAAVLGMLAEARVTRRFKLVESLDDIPGTVRGSGQNFGAVRIVTGN